jgi:hypothetical protein
MDEGTVDSSTINKQVAPELRTFRGWKRNTAHLDKSQLTKSLSRSPVSFLRPKSFSFNRFFLKLGVK